MGSQDRWIATGMDPLKVVIENIPEEKESKGSPKPIPVVDNLPLEDYKQMEDNLEKARDKIECYERMIKNIFGDVTFLENVIPYEVGTECVEDELTRDFLFLVKYKVKKDQLGDYEVFKKHLDNILLLY